MSSMERERGRFATLWRRTHGCSDVSLKDLGLAANYHKLAVRWVPRACEDGIGACTIVGLHPSIAAGFTTSLFSIGVSLDE